jgi:hypothetical protein
MISRFPPFPVIEPPVEVATMMPPLVLWNSNFSCWSLVKRTSGAKR